MTGPSDSGVQVDYALLNKLVDAVTLHVTGRPEWPDDWRNLRSRLAAAIYPERRAALPVALPKSQLKRPAHAPDPVAAIRAIAKMADLEAALDEPHPPSRHCMCAECRPSFDDDAPLPVAALSDADRELMEQIKQHIRDYHFALDMREHGGVAQDKAYRAIEEAMGMQWRQGEEKSRRALLRHSEGKE